MIHGIEVTNDYSFKKLFGTERNLVLTRSLLNAVLEMRKGKLLLVDTVDLLTPFNVKETITDKLSIADIKARDQRGRRYSLEMQQFAPSTYSARMVYYWARDFSTQLREGQDYGLLKPTMSISFINSVRTPESKGWYARYVLRDDLRNGYFSDLLEFHTFELPKFTMNANTLATSMEKWLYFFIHAATLDSDALPPALRTPEFIRAMQELIMISQDEREQNLYEQAYRAKLDALTFQREEERAQLRLSRLEQDCEQLQQERQTLQQERQTLQQERQTLQHNNQTLQQERQTLQHNNQTLQQERDTARKSRFVERIQLCQDFLGEPVTPEDQLLQKSLAELTRLADEWLQRRRPTN